jgi:hypothetical protein
MKFRTLTLMVAALGLLALVGCSEDDATSPGASTLATADKDAAEAIATDLGSDDGGLVDQLSDAVDFAGGIDLGAKAAGECEGLRDAVYDDATGTWTITIERERGEVGDVPYAAFTRVYTVRFLDAAGEPQERYDVDGSLANTIEFAIVSGSGLHATRRVEHALDALEGQFVIADAHTELVTINGTYLRSGTHSLANDRFSREHSGTLTLALTDVVAPRGAGRDLSAAVSGTVSGTYEATITVTRGDDYTEKEIYREFTVELGDGDAVMEMNRKQYRARLKSGELDGD